MESCLRYPVTGSFIISVVLYFFIPLCVKERRAQGWSWVARCAVAFAALLSVLTIVIPPLQIVSVRVILRPTPGCSTEMDPRRLLCAIVDENQVQTFYESTKPSCARHNGTELVEGTGMPYYVISSWIPAPNHFRARTNIAFDPQLESTEQQCFFLPKGRCIRIAGPTEEDPLKVEISKWKERRRQSVNVGFVNRSSLEVFNTGFYVVSNCKTDAGRWLFKCTIAYVNSYYVRLPAYMRILLLEDWKKKQ